MKQEKDRWILTKTVGSGHIYEHNAVGDGGRTPPAGVWKAHGHAYTAPTIVIPQAANERRTPASAASGGCTMV